MKTFLIVVVLFINRLSIISFLSKSQYWDQYPNLRSKLTKILFYGNHCEVVHFHYWMQKHDQWREITNSVLSALKIVNCNINSIIVMNHSKLTKIFFGQQDTSVTISPKYDNFKYKISTSFPFFFSPLFLLVFCVVLWNKKTQVYE